MPSVDIDIDDFLYSCSSYDIKELINALVEDDHLPKDILNEKKEVKMEYSKRGRLEIEFSEKLELLKSKYYSLTEEEENLLNNIFSKYL